MGQTLNGSGLRMRIAAVTREMGLATSARRGWAGPLPPRSHGPHTYAFQLFALGQAVSLPASFTLDDTLAAIAGHIIGRARLDGTYEIC